MRLIVAFFSVIMSIMCLLPSAVRAYDDEVKLSYSTEFSFIVQPSPRGGVGIFATHDIPAGTLLLCHPNGHKVRILNIRDIPEPLRKYCIYITTEQCIAPERFDRMEIGWYMNHSSMPNAGAQGDTEIASDGTIYSNFYALRDIKAGEELVMDYNELNEPEELKEDFYYQ